MNERMKIEINEKDKDHEEFKRSMHEAKSNADKRMIETLEKERLKLKKAVYSYEVI